MMTGYKIQLSFKNYKECVNNVNEIPKIVLKIAKMFKIDFKFALYRPRPDPKFAGIELYRSDDDMPMIRVETDPPDYIYELRGVLLKNSARILGAIEEFKDRDEEPVIRDDDLSRWIGRR